MSKGLLAALATGILLSVATSAPAQRYGFGLGYGRGYRRSGFGLGLGFGGYPRTSAAYQNAFTGDVEYAERATNDFRADYEKRRRDPLGIKADVQRLDRTMEAIRQEARRYGAVTDRGADLMRDALDAEDRIDRRFRDSNDEMRRQWDGVRRMVDRLAREYRVD